MYDAYRMRLQSRGSYIGEVRRNNAQKIMDATWMRDIATKPVYVKWCNTGTPMLDDDDVPVYAKHNVKSYHSISGDEVAYLLQFRLEDLNSRSDIKVGSYAYIPNENGTYEWWLLVHLDDRSSFRQFSILKCTWTYKWVSDIDGKRKIHECLGCPRKQNSYNSGVWLDYRAQTVENQEVMWLTTNDDTKTIQYDTKFLKSETGRMPPLAYKVSKIEDTAVRGITRFTMTQEQYDPVHDNAELLIGNYYEKTIEPVLSEIPEIENVDLPSNIQITYSGTPSVRAGGGYKKFVLKSVVGDELSEYIGAVDWSVDFASGDSDKLNIITDGSAIKIKCSNDYSLIGKSFTLIAKIANENAAALLVVEVTSL